jgi:hypothetical protein
MTIPVTLDNFARAETDRMFAGLVQQAGGLNRWSHSREPTPIDNQPVIRMNRDTLYSMAVVDISDGAVLTVPDAGGRYLSVMVVNEDHYVNRIFHEAGEYPLAVAEFDTPYVLLAARTLADPTDSRDMAAAHAVQDGLAVRAAAARPFVMPDYDPASFESARAQVVALAGDNVTGGRGFGRRADVDPERHLILTALGWGGLPDEEAHYESRSPNLPTGVYRITVRDVPVDAFWSISVYNRDGFFEPNELGVYSVNSVTATRNPDDSVTVQFGGCGNGRPNCIPIVDGWNYLIRLYRPRPPILDGSWRFPEIEPVA